MRSAGEAAGDAGGRVVSGSGAHVVVASLGSGGAPDERHPTSGNKALRQAQDCFVRRNLKSTERLHGQAKVVALWFLQAIS